jgi:outer membrane protein OmpA-like peptidoglycan-associated protein
MTKPIILLLFLTLNIGLTSAQLDSKELKEKITEADEYILAEDFSEALLILKEIKEEGSGNPNIDFKTGYCYLHSIAEKERALPLLKSASQHISRNYNRVDPLEKKAPMETILLLGDAYRLANDYKEALNCYKQYGILLEDTVSKAISQKRIKECYVGQLLRHNPVNVKFEKENTTINQGLSNYNPVISSDGQTLAFTRKMKFYDALFISRNENGKWQEPENITTQIGSDGEYYPSGLSSDGKKLLLTCYNATSGYDIYESDYDGTRWSKVKKLDGGVNSSFVEIDATYSPDDKSIFFASNRDGGFGSFDIFRSDRKDDNSWSQAINAGGEINTNADEKSPHFIDKGKYLVFSSGGHLGMGGLDLCYVSYPVEPASKVRNMGYPINSVVDDVSFSPVMKQNISFVSRHDKESKSESDVFRAEYASLSNLYEVQVKTALQLDGVPAGDKVDLYLVDATQNDTIDKVTVDNNKVNLDFDLYPGKFIVIAQNPANRICSASFLVPEDLETHRYETPLLFSFVKPDAATQIAQSGATNDTLTIKNIIFEFDRYSLGNQYRLTLDDVVKLMKEQPSAKLVITGYADILGSEAYNKKLSQMRADEVKHYLTTKGIEGKRLKATGAGSANYLAINSNADGTDNPEGRKYNRRVELRLENIPGNIILVKETAVPDSLRIQ